MQIICFYQVATLACVSKIVKNVNITAAVTFLLIDMIVLQNVRYYHILRMFTYHAKRNIFAE